MIQPIKYLDISIKFPRNRIYLDSKNDVKPLPNKEESENWKVKFIPTLQEKPRASYGCST